MYSLCYEKFETSQLERTPRRQYATTTAAVRLLTGGIESIMRELAALNRINDGARNQHTITTVRTCPRMTLLSGSSLNDTQPEKYERNNSKKR